MRIGSLFSGIGGLELGLELSGVGGTVWQVENNEYCRRVLAKYWPNVKRFEDVKEVGAKQLEPVDLICGGFPCQDVSSAGKGAGLTGSRSGLWFEFARLVSELRPQWVVVENVASGASRWVDTVVSGLEQQGYACLPIPLSAADVGAPHLRRRLFVVAYADRFELRQQQRRRGGEDGQGAAELGDVGDAWPVADASGDRWATERQWTEDRYTDWRSELRSGVEAGRVPEPAIRGMANGFPYRLDRLRALGNAVVPQCAEVVGWVIRELQQRSEP